MVQPTLVHLLLGLQLQLGGHVQVRLHATEVFLQDLRVLRDLLKIARQMQVIKNNFFFLELEKPFLTWVVKLLKYFYVAKER
jgi:hypothetical protein